MSIPTAPGGSGAPGTIAQAVEWLAELPSSTGLFTDFDGTLAPIVERPDEARPLGGAIEALALLAETMGVVAVVSGRPVEYLMRRVVARGVHLYGLHGVQHALAGGRVELAPGAAAWRGVLAEATGEARAAALPGVEIEDKTFGLTLHWRAAADPRSAEPPARRLAERLASSRGLVLRPGKASVELVPPIGIDKGTVLAGWTDSLTRLAFIGDDVGDLLAFRVLDAIRAQGRAETLKVAVTSAEAPAELLEGADLILAEPADAVDLLVALADIVT